MNLGPYSVEFVEAVWPSLGGEARVRLSAYSQDLLRYNRAQNLVSRKSPEVRVAALIEECVAAGQIVDRRALGGSWADVGSGGGVPGLILACMFPSRSLTLIERRQGRCDFLRREARVLDLPSVEVFEGDVEDWDGPPFDIVFAKAVANPGQIEQLCARIVGQQLLVFGRPDDPLADGWELEWSEPLPGVNSVLRSLARS
jgi:16S rRNA (guanine527-N7)-methyltransferase